MGFSLDAPLSTPRWVILRARASWTYLRLVEHTLPRRRPRALADVIGEGDLVITVCDLAHEDLGVPHKLHWSVPDPVRVGTDAASDAAHEEIEGRVRALAPRLAS